MNCKLKVKRSLVAKQSLAAWLIIAMVTIIGFVVGACDNSTTSTGGNTACKHTWGEWTITTAPTCVAAGTGTRICNLCKEADSNTVVPIDSGNHHLVIKSATATCTEGGDATWKCDRNSCTYEKVETGRPALGHDFIHYIEIKPANCTEAGSEKATCERDGCDEADEKVIPKNDHHDWEMLSGTPSTCTTHGKGKEKCRLCGDEEEGDHLPLDPYNHTFTQWQETAPPNCVTAAIET